MYGWSSEEAMAATKEMIVPEVSPRRAETAGRGVASWDGEFAVRGRDGTTFPRDRY